MTKTRCGSRRSAGGTRYIPLCQRISGGKRLLEQKDLTGNLSFNDEMAFGARGSHRVGLKVPDDVSLVGFDNWDLSGYANMKLTTVERNMGEIARGRDADSAAPSGGRNHR